MKNPSFAGYEREVISVPAAPTYHMVRQHGVHACPHIGVWAGYRPSRYMVFRPTGGELEMLYGVDEVLQLDPYAPDLTQVPTAIRLRVEAYIEQRMREWGFSKDSDFNFYILSETDQIPLLHKPRVWGQNRSHVYLRFKDVTEGEPLIRVASWYGDVDDGEESEPEALPTVADFIAEMEEGGEENADQVPLPDPLQSSWSWPTHFDPASPDFDADGLLNEREKVATSIVIRRGRAQFRQMLLHAYGNQCAITGYDLPAALEAAHITGYLGPKSDHPANGLLLRGDIHTLFDLRLIAVDTESMTVVLAPELLETPYKYLQNKKLYLPEDTRLHPDKRALATHRQEAGL